MTPTSPPPPAGATRLTVDITRSRDGRLEGTIRSETHEGLPFSGVLELLWALEEILQARPPGNPPGTGSA